MSGNIRLVGEHSASSGSMKENQPPKRQGCEEFVGVSAGCVAMSNASHSPEDFGALGVLAVLPSLTDSVVAGHSVSRTERGHRS